MDPPLFYTCAQSSSSVAPLILVASNRCLFERMAFPFPAVAPKLLSHLSFVLLPGRHQQHWQGAPMVIGRNHFRPTNLCVTFGRRPRAIFAIRRENERAAERQSPKNVCVLRRKYILLGEEGGFRG